MMFTMIRVSCCAVLFSPFTAQECCLGMARSTTIVACQDNMACDSKAIEVGATSLVYLGPLTSESKVTQLESEDELTAVADCTGDGVAWGNTSTPTPYFSGPSRDSL